MKVAIIGGTKGLGKTLARYFKSFDFEVTITGRDTTVGTMVSAELEVDYSNDNIETVKSNQIVIISVPISSTEKVIEELAPYMKEGSLMIDVTSVKEGPSQKMKEFLPNTVEYIPTHPVFGPRTTDLTGQVIVLTPLNKGEWYPKVYKFLEDKGLRIIETSPEHHDKMMGIVQVLTHFAYICTASAIEKLKVNIKDTEDYESPIYNLMIDTIARIVSQNPYLTYSIQNENKQGEEIRQAFFDSVLELKDTISNHDEETFVDIALKATKHMGDIQGALGRSDKAINSLTQELNILKKSIGKEIGLRHIYSGKVHVGELKKIEFNFASLKTNTRTKRIKVSNVEILNEEELFNWKVNNQQTYSRDISCMFPRISDENIIKNTLIKLDDITDIQVKDVYDGEQIKENYLSYTFQVTGLTKESINEVETTLKAFGGIIR